MDVTTLFLQNVQPGQIYYFSSTTILSAESHYFVCISKNEEEVIYTTCSTTQFQKRSAYIEKMKLPRTTLVLLNPSILNVLPKQSFIDCNSFQEHQLLDLLKLSANRMLRYVGDLNEADLDQIQRGLLDSPEFHLI